MKEREQVVGQFGSIFVPLGHLGLNLLASLATSRNKGSGRNQLELHAHSLVPADIEARVIEHPQRVASGLGIASYQYHLIAVCFFTGM